MTKENLFRIEISKWSSTDFAFLMNNTLGWVNDAATFYEFSNFEDFNRMQDYLMETHSDQSTLHDIR